MKNLVVRHFFTLTPRWYFCQGNPQNLLFLLKLCCFFFFRVWCPCSLCSITLCLDMRKWRERKGREKPSFGYQHGKGGKRGKGIGLRNSVTFQAKQILSTLERFGRKHANLPSCSLPSPPFSSKMIFICKLCRSMSFTRKIH